MNVLCGWKRGRKVKRSATPTRHARRLTGLEVCSPTRRVVYVSDSGGGGGDVEKLFLAKTKDGAGQTR